MIDRQPPQPHSHSYGVRQPPPTTVSYGTGLTERRSRHSGQIEAKPCPRCATAVALDSRRMQLADGRPVIGCLACGALVTVRRADLHRAPLEGPPNARAPRRRRGWWARKA
jgi:hypothetical protein